MLKRLPSSFALLPAVAFFGLPCLAASHAHRASAPAHAPKQHATVAHASLHNRAVSHAALRHASVTHESSRYTPLRHAALTRDALSHPARGRYAERAERVAVVHHEPLPAIEASRATEIQAALIRAGYLSGEPSGVWDSESIAAMQKLQDDNGWQTKFTPDSRALVKLGLGGAPAQTLPLPQTAELTTAVPASQP